MDSGRTWLSLACVFGLTVGFKIRSILNVHNGMDLVCLEWSKRHRLARVAPRPESGDPVR